MEIRRFPIEGPLEIVPRKIEDQRGYFSEIFRLSIFSEIAGPVKFVQENQSFSARNGTIRGIHFQTHPFEQGKLVRCLSGKIFDVAVDLRTGSPSYGGWISAVLTPREMNQLWVPAGFGHAFCTMETNSTISYRVTNYYSLENDKGVAWDDPNIAVDWPRAADPATLSDKDRTQPRLSGLPQYFEERDI